MRNFAFAGIVLVITTLAPFTAAAESPERATTAPTEVVRLLSEEEREFWGLCNQAIEDELPLVLGEKESLSTDPGSMWEEVWCSKASYVTLTFDALVRDFDERGHTLDWRGVFLAAQERREKLLAALPQVDRSALAQFSEFKDALLDLNYSWAEARAKHKAAERRSAQK